MGKAPLSDCVQALLLDPELSVMLFVQSEAGKPESSQAVNYTCFQSAVAKGEHPIPALRRQLFQKLGITLSEGQYYYLQTLIGPEQRDCTQYLVLCKKDTLIPSLSDTTRWIRAEANELSTVAFDADTESALRQFASRHHGEANRLNLVHMLSLTARSP